MNNETIAWKICYTDNGQYRTVLSEHNSVGDYRAIDPMASSIALCAAPVSVEPVGLSLEVRTLGSYGKAFDLPGNRRAYTYDHQPGNVEASRLGTACQQAVASSAGDYIDRGLSLLKELQALGFGVFDIDSSRWHAAPVAAQAQQQDADKVDAEPDMFWNADNPEQCQGSIHNLLVEVQCDRTLRVGDIVEIQQAMSLPNISVRVTAVDTDDDDGDLEYEIVNESTIDAARKEPDQ